MKRKLPVVAVCLFGDAPQWEVDCWLRCWKASGNRNKVVALSIKERPFTGQWPFPTVYAKNLELPKADTGGSRGLSDCIKAQGFSAVKAPCIVMDVDCMVMGDLRKLPIAAPMAMAREYQSGRRRWKPYGMELNAGVCFQNDSRIWPLFQKLWHERLKTNPGGGCFGQYIFGQVSKSIGGQVIHRRFNYMEHCAPFLYEPRIPRDTVIAHFHSDGERFLRDIADGRRELSLKKIGRYPVKLFLATPCYYQSVGFNYMSSIQSEIPKLCEAGISVTIQYSIGDAVQKQRNTLAMQFLKSGCDLMLMVDSDMGFRAEDIIRDIKYGKPVMGCNYPTRRLRWEAMAGNSIEQVKNSMHVGITIGYRNNQTMKLNMALASGTNHPFKPLKVAYIGGGYMLIQRRVLTRIANRKLVPARKGGGWQFFAFTAQETGEQRGEDYSFCDLARKVGFDVWLDPQARCSHLGMYLFDGVPTFAGVVPE